MRITRPRRKIVAYYRVSTKKQGDSGLGLEAQQMAVAQYAEQHDAEIIGEYVEIETGKRADRPNLAEAIGHAKEGAKLAPDHFAPVLILGRLYQFTDRLDLATKAFNRAVALNPDSVEAVRELRIMRMRQDRKSARGLISRLLDNIYSE